MQKHIKKLIWKIMPQSGSQISIFLTQGAEVIQSRYHRYRFDLSFSILSTYAAECKKTHIYFQKFLL